MIHENKLKRVRVAFLTVALCAVSSMASGVALPDPIVWYDMESVVNGKIPDKSGNGRDLSLESGATLTNGCGGAAGNALFFAGSAASSAFFSCPALGSRTVSFWFRRGKGSGALSYESGNTYPYLVTDLSSLRMHFSNKSGEEFKSSVLTASSTYFSQNVSIGVWRETWTHIAITLDETSKESNTSHVTYKLYVNGKCVAAPSTDFTIDNLASAGTTCLGNLGRNQGRPICGALDEFRVWDTALSSDQVAAEYERAKVSYGEPLVGHWTFDETTTSGGSLVLTDVAGQAGNIMCGSGIVVTNAGIEGKAVYCNGYRACYGALSLPDAFDNGITWTCWINQSIDSWKNTATKIGGNNAAPRLINGGSWYMLTTRGAQASDWDTRKIVLMRIGNNNAEDTCDNSRPPQGAWGHLAVTTRIFMNASGTRRCSTHIYMNGELAATIPERDVGSQSFATAWCFANNTSNGTRPFEGFIDDLRLYAGEISSNTIVRLYRGAAAVDAGADFSVAGDTAELHGEIGTSAPNGVRTGYAGVPCWSLVSAPAGGEGAAILQPGRTVTQVTLPVEGAYVFRLSNTLDDVGLSRSDDVTVTRIAAAGSAPALSLASSSVSGEVDIPVKLEATATSGARVHWEKVSGSGGAWFEPENASVTAARFGAAGTYVVRCIAEKDGASSTADATVTVSTASGSCDVSDGLIGWWPLAGADMLCDKGLSSARPNMTTNENGTVLETFEEGLSGLAFRPNAFKAYFSLGDTLRETKSTSDGNSPPTTRYRAVSAWVYHDSADTNDFKYAAIFMVPYTLGLYYNSDCSDGTVNGLFLYQQGWRTTDTVIADMTMPFALPYSFTNRWTHIYALYDRSEGTDFELWVDGVKRTPTSSVTTRRGRVKTSSYVGGLPYDTTSQASGYWKRNGSEERMSRCFPGKIADLRIYNRKLTGREIKTLAANPEMCANRAPAVDAFAKNPVNSESRKPKAIAAVVFDDGEPEGSSLTYSWSVISGDASKVMFGDATARETTFTASKSDTYVVQLAVSDGERMTCSEPLTVEATAGLIISFR